MAFNAGKDDAWSCWLTRRMSLVILKKLAPYLEKTSAVVAQAPFEHRHEVAVMEREMALSSTQNAISQTPETVLAKADGNGELVIDVTLTPRPSDFVVLLSGSAGGKAQGILTRAHLQTVLHLLEQEVTKASWLTLVTVTAATEIEAQAGERRRKSH